MDHFRKLQRQILLRLFLLMFTTILLTACGAWALYSAFDWQPVMALLAGTGLALVLGFCLATIASPLFLGPVKTLWQAILHVSAASQNVRPPELDKIRLGRELLTSLVTHVYELARHDGLSRKDTQSHDLVLQASNIVSHLPLPMFVCNKDQKVINASGAAIEYCQLDSTQLLGRPFFESVLLEFPNEFTLESWMTDCQTNKVTDQAYWERVRVRIKGDDKVLRQCDMAAYYNRDNPSGTEFIITMFDRTERYEQDDQALSFIALAVHELRTPLTILRGYIEVFEEELEGKLDPEMKSFMDKLEVSAEQLTGFVNNILNVARVEDNQLVLQLNEEDWAETLAQAVKDNELHAHVHGKSVTLNIDKNLPPIAVDRVSIYEVISNLLDNAIKYSATSKEIIVSTKLAADGTVVTTIQDFGVGIPTSVLPNMFEKFYRNHRTRQQIGGTGLGLYLSKAIITAHGGQIWAESKEGEGSTFGFSLIPYANLADELKNSNNKEITRAAHGWVKNHSFYRR